MPIELTGPRVVGIGSTSDAVHFSISDISVIRANGHIIITHED